MANIAASLLLTQSMALQPLDAKTDLEKELAVDRTFSGIDCPTRSPWVDFDTREKCVPY